MRSDKNMNTAKAIFEAHQVFKRLCGLQRFLTLLAGCLHETDQIQWQSLYLTISRFQKRLSRDAWMMEDNRNLQITQYVQLGENRVGSLLKQDTRRRLMFAKNI